ncbi:hypothetical protein [Paracoccus sp. 22332]|uniref:hypothetical protein n=1 Tax=Paracoccus sp. 22332 TaxID=3453913 RepID=UPI003F83EBF3
MSEAMTERQLQQPTSVRLPADMKRDLRIMAAIHEQTLSDEIVIRLRRSLSEEKQQEAAGGEFGDQAPAAGNENAAFERGAV